MSFEIAGMIVSIFAFFATAAIAIAAWLQTTQSVRPFLYTTSIKTKKDGGLSIKFFLHNAGLGPAIIKDFYLLYKAEEYRGDDAHELIENLIYDQPFKHYTLFPNSAIKRDEEYEILSIDYIAIDQDPHLFERRIDDNITLVVEYESFLKRPYTYRSDSHEWASHITKKSKENEQKIEAS